MDPFEVASVELARVDGNVQDLARPFLDLLPITGASVSTLGPLVAAETISATDSRAHHIDELQFDLGEGPCWDAITSKRPVLEPDLVHRTDPSWPAFSDAIQPEGIGAIFAFPLIVRGLEIGAVDLYSMRPTSLSATHQQQAVALANIVSRILLRRAIDALDLADAATPMSRRLIHQATGLVMAQLSISADDAYVVIQAHAFAENTAMQEIARNLVERRFRFSPNDAPTKEAP